MKKSNILKIAMLMVFFGIASVYANEMKMFKLDAGSSKIKWTGEKVTGSHHGELKFDSGNLEVSGDTFKGGAFSTDMTSIRVNDLTGEMKGKLEGHLKSDDFFSVAKNPNAFFEITSITPSSKVEGFNYMVSGNMKIKGITKKITFPAKIDFIGKNKIKATAKLVIDRSKFDVKYGSGSFFDNLGDKMIYDDFTLELEMHFRI